MKLTPSSSSASTRKATSSFPNYFSPEETADPEAEIPGVFAAAPRGERAREDRRRGAHQLRRAHLQPAVRKAGAPSAHGRAGEQLLGERLYMHQFKINGKVAFDGDVWQWHQDYGTWKDDDQMPEARAMNVAIFLDEVNEFNGPLMFIPGSHKQGVLDAKHDLTTTQLSAVDDRQRHHRQAGRAQGGIVAPKGPAGLDDPVPRLPGARHPAQPVAVEPRRSST